MYYLRNINKVLLQHAINSEPLPTVLITRYKNILLVEANKSLMEKAILYPNVEISATVSEVIDNLEKGLSRANFEGTLELKVYNKLLSFVEPNSKRALLNFYCFEEEGTVVGYQDYDRNFIDVIDFISSTMRDEESALATPEYEEIINQVYYYLTKYSDVEILFDSQVIQNIYLLKVFKGYNVDIGVVYRGGTSVTIKLTHDNITLALILTEEGSPYEYRTIWYDGNLVNTKFFSNKIVFTREKELMEVYALVTVPSIQELSVTPKQA